MPAVSIITPAWNAGRYLGETIASVQAQTFPDWEWLIVDDGSTDETAALVREHAARDARIRLLQQPNSGPSTARNHGMRQAKGTYFAFLDSDDLWAPNHLASQLDVFRRHPETGLVTANAVFLGGPFDGLMTRPAADGFPVVPLEEIISNECAVFIMTTFRREVFDAIGGFDEAQWTSEDYDFWLRAALAGFVFRRNSAPLGRYRVRDGSLSRNAPRMIRGLLQTYGKTRPRCPDGSAARRAVDAQISRFELQLLLEEAKLAMEAQDFATASQRLRALQARGGGANVRLVAWLAEHLPSAALLAYRMRGWRQLVPWLRRQPPPNVAAGAAT